MLATGPLARLWADSSSLDDLAFRDAVPKEVFEAALVKFGKTADRHGAKLPHWLVLRLIIGLCFFRDLDIPSALDRVAGVFGVPTRWRGQVPHSTSIAQARDRLGFDVVRGLYWGFSEHLVDQLTDTDRWGGLVVTAIDATMLDAPDTEANAAAFKRPGGRNGSGGFPKLRLLAVVSTASHFVLAGVAGPCKGKGTGETSLAPELLPYLRPDWLLLMDKGLCSYQWLKQLDTRPFFVRKTEGKSAVTPTKVGPPLLRGKDCWIDYLPKSAKAGQEPLRLRWIRIKLKKKKGRKKRWVEFLTNLDPESFPYDALVDLYLNRWEVEFAFREMKCDVMRKQRFRSHTPTRVLQELYGLLIAYNAIRLRMAQAAKPAGVEPRQLSFRQAAMLFQLAALSGIPTRVVLKILRSYRIFKRDPRSYPRVVKKPASKFAANRRRAAGGG